MKCWRKVEAAAGMRERLAKIGLTFPRELTLTITSLCNLNCCHCWPECGPDNRNFHVPLDDLYRVIQLFHDAGLKQICLTGGEPFLHPGWQRILDDCCCRQGITAVKIQTNGTLVSDKIVTLLQQEKYRKVSLQISLDGWAEEHDAIRGEGSFFKTFAALALLQEKGMAKRTFIAFTETAANFSQLPKTLQLVDELGLAGLTSNTLVSAGRAERNTSLQMPTPKQYTELIELYENDAEFKELYGRSGNIAAIEWYRNRGKKGSHDTCSCVATPYIDSKGVLYPCTLLPVPYLAINNVWSKTLQEIENEIEIKWAQLHNLSEKRPQWISECQSCIGRNHCQSGCLGRSFPMNGDFFKREDRCEHRKAVYSWCR